MMKKLFPFIFLSLLPTIPCFSFVKELGIGNTGVAYPQTSNSANYNPAGITDLPDRYDVSMGVAYQHGRNKIKDSDNPDLNISTNTTKTKYLPGSIFGICKKLNNCLYVGISVDGTRVFKSSFSRTIPIFGHGRQGLDNFIAILVPTLAWKFNRQHSFGISFPISFSRTKVKGFQNIAFASVSPDHVSNKGYDWAYGLGIRLGWLWHITPCLNFGLFYSPKLLTASHFHKYRGNIPVRGKLEVPPVVRAGLAYKFWRSHFVIELEYNFYELARTLSNSPFSTALAGSKSGPSLGWKNSLVLKLGADYQVSDAIVVRGGYYTYRFPPTVRGSNTLAHFGSPIFITRDYWVVGGTWQIDCKTEFSFAYNCGVRRTQHGDRSLALANGRVDIEYELHTIYFGVGRLF